MTAYDDLMAFTRETTALGEIAGRLGWDQETMMPKGAAPQRGEEMAAIDTSTIGDVGKAQVRHIQRSFDRTSKVPTDLAATIARVTSTAQGTWAAAREDDDVAAFAPTFEEVINLKRQEGEALAAGGDVYDSRTMNRGQLPLTWKQCLARYALN